MYIEQGGELGVKNRHWHNHTIGPQMTCQEIRIQPTNVDLDNDEKLNRRTEKPNKLRRKGTQTVDSFSLLSSRPTSCWDFSHYKSTFYAPGTTIG